MVTPRTVRGSFKNSSSSIFLCEIESRRRVVRYIVLFDTLNALARTFQSPANKFHPALVSASSIAAKSFEWKFSRIEFVLIIRLRARLDAEIARCTDNLARPCLSPYSSRVTSFFRSVVAVSYFVRRIARANMIP